MIITIKKRNFNFISFSIILIVGAIVYAIGTRKVDAKDTIKANSNSVTNKTVVLDARSSVSPTGRSSKQKWDK